MARLFPYLIHASCHIRRGDPEIKQQTSEYSELTAMFKKPGSDDLSFVPFCIILLEAAMENGYAVINDA